MGDVAVEQVETFLVLQRFHLIEQAQDRTAGSSRRSFQATPSRRAYIPKADGRLLGIAALEDKIVQRAAVEVMNAVFEVDFRNFSYGFRPRRSPHNALDALAVGTERRKVNWVLDADICDFFTNVDRGWLMRFLRHRIADERLLRLVGKWLAAGVVEEGIWSEAEARRKGHRWLAPRARNRSAVRVHHGALAPVDNRLGRVMRLSSRPARIRLSWRRCAR